MSENTNEEELPNPIFCSTCPECGAYPLEKDTYEKDDDTIFQENCPNCYYSNIF